MTPRARRWCLVYTAAVVVGSAVACAGSDDAVGRNGARAELEMAAWPTTALTVASFGNAPRAELRVATPTSPDGTVTEEVRWETRFETSAARGAVTSDPVVVTQRRTFLISASGGSPIDYDFEVAAASDDARGGDALDPAVVAALRGRRGRWRASALCRVVDAGIDTDGGPADRHLPGLLRTAVDLCPLLPEEPLGLGAQWTATQVQADGSTVSTEWMLVQRYEGRSVLTFTASSDRGGGETLGEGRLEIDPSRSVPVRYDARGRTTRVVEEQESTGVRTPITWISTWSMNAEATLREG